MLTAFLALYFALFLLLIEQQYKLLSHSHYVLILIVLFSPIDHHALDINNIILC